MVTETNQSYSFLIGGIECVSKVVEGTEVVRTRKTIAGDTATLKLDTSVTDLVTLTAGMTVVVSRGDVTATEEYLFRGTINSIDEKNSVYELSCVNNLYRLKYDLFSKSYDQNIDPEAGVISAIAQDIIEDGGLTASVVATGTDTIVEKFKSDRNDRLNRLEILSKIVNYILVEDYNNDWIRFEPEGYNVYSTPLVAGAGSSSSNIYNLPIWLEDIVSMRNKIYVDGAFEEDTKTETFNGDGSTATFTLTYRPETVNLTVSGVEQKLGIEESTESYDYTLDKDQYTFTFVTGSIPGAGTGNISMTYTYKIPYTSVGTSRASIDLYNLTQAESYKFDDIVTVQDADNRVLALLNKLAFANVITSLLTDARNIRPGMKVNVVDNYHPTRNGEYIVQSVTTSYPQPFDILKIGDSDFDVADMFSTIRTRLNALEGDKDLVNEVLRQLFDLFFTVKYRSYYFKKQSFDITTTPDVFYWDSIDQGLWADDAETIGFNWADDSEETFSDDVIVQGNNTYYELCYDTDFHDSVNSTATFNTSNKIISFAADQVWYSSAIAKGQTYSFFTMRVGSFTGSLTYEVSFDNKVTWQTVSSFNVRTAINVSNANGVYVRITEASSSTASLQPVYTVNNVVSDAAITIIMEE